MLNRGKQRNNCFLKCLKNMCKDAYIWIYVCICVSKSWFSCDPSVGLSSRTLRAPHRAYRTRSCWSSPLWASCLSCKLGHRWNIADSQLQATKRCWLIFIDPCRKEFANNDAFMTNGENEVPPSNVEEKKRSASRKSSSLWSWSTLRVLASKLFVAKFSTSYFCRNSACGL